MPSLRQRGHAGTGPWRRWRPSSPPGPGCRVARPGGGGRPRRGAGGIAARLDRHCLRRPRRPPRRARRPGRTRGAAGHGPGGPALGLLALGEHAAVLAATEQAGRRHPLRERTRSLQALALVRTGRQVEALEGLRGYRELLADELGLDPGPEVRALEEAVLRQSPALGCLAAPARRLRRPAGAGPALPPPAPGSAAGADLGDGRPRGGAGRGRGRAPGRTGGHARGHARGR